MAKKRRKRYRKFREPTQLALRRNDLDHFDRLPAELRAALNEATVKFSAHVVYQWLQWGMTCEQIITQLKLNQHEFARTWDREA